MKAIYCIFFVLQKKNMRETDVANKLETREQFHMMGLCQFCTNTKRKQNKKTNDMLCFYGILKILAHFAMK